MKFGCCLTGDGSKVALFAALVAASKGLLGWLLRKKKGKAAKEAEQGQKE